VGAGGGGNAPAASAAAVSSEILGGGIGGGLLILIALISLAAWHCNKKRERVSEVKGAAHLEMAPMAAVVSNPLAMLPPSVAPAHQQQPDAHPTQRPALGASV